MSDDSAICLPQLVRHGDKPYGKPVALEESWLLDSIE